MGVTALDSHMKGAKHTACSTARQCQPPVGPFCAPRISSVTETALCRGFSPECFESSPESFRSSALLPQCREGSWLPDNFVAAERQEDDIHNVQSVIDSLALDYLQISLSHITGENIVRGEKESIRNLLEIFDGLLDYLIEQQSDEEPQYKVKEALAATLAEMVENPKKRKRPADCYTGDEGLCYDICTGRKHKAVKSCLDSDYQNHHEKREIFFKGERQNLTEATGRLQEMICQTHDKLLEVFCLTDQRCICVLCTFDEHKNHDHVSAAAQRTEKQKQLKETQRSFQQRIQQREKDLQQLREAVESHKRSAQTAVEDSERIFNELIRSIERSRSEATQRIRDQEKTAVSRAEGRLERLEQEINDLRRRDAELEQLSHTQDHILFLQSFQSLSAPPESTDVHDDDPFSSLSFFDGVRESVLVVLEDFCKEKLKKFFDRVDERQLFSGIPDIVHVDGDVASGESQENQPGESPVVESEHSPNSVTERSSSCVSPPEDPVREKSCDPIVSRLQAGGDVNECTLSTPRRGLKRLREAPGASQDYEDRGLELHKGSQLDVCSADVDESSSDESDPGPPIEQDMSRLSYGMMTKGTTHKEMSSGGRSNSCHLTVVFGNGCRASAAAFD
ncbi:Centrosomal protein of 95 kDa [Anabarilius grahami]|uniref:Centrosomal protein of 95 kDa n=1 Tax=Anabarilius grahami TaxID=495550 RepID=A0A3N0YJF0_ANAGA|nr:Centrosomal protein of 95 kDa [Anabarilius grahami]